MLPLFAQCHTGGCTQDMTPSERVVAEQAKAQADEVLLLALALVAIGFLLVWGRQYEREQRLLRE